MGIRIITFGAKTPQVLPAPALLSPVVHGAGLVVGVTFVLLTRTVTSSLETGDWIVACVRQCPENIVQGRKSTSIYTNNDQHPPLCQKIFKIFSARLYNLADSSST